MLHWALATVQASLRHNLQIFLVTQVNVIYTAQLASHAVQWLAGQTSKEA
jgi:hypothetical protein